MGFFDKAEGTAQFFDQEDIEKAYGTKYKSKKLINGKWRYYYVDGREESVKWHDHNANKSEIREFIKESFNNSEYKENIKICDLPSHFSDKLKLKIGERPTKLIMNSDGLRHSLNLERHKINPEDILLLQKVIQNKHTIIRNAGKSKRRKNDLIEFTGYSRGTIKFILAIDEKNKELRLFDCYREGKIEKSVRFPCTSPETNALDGSQPIISINFIDNLSTEKLNKSLSIDDRLLRLWQRRLSPELQKKMEVLREYLHNKGSVSLKNPSNTILSNSQNMSSNIEKSHLYISKKWMNGKWKYEYPEDKYGIRVREVKHGLLDENGKKLEFKLNENNYKLLEYYNKGSHDYIFINKTDENDRIPAWKELKVTHSEYLERTSLRKEFNKNIIKYRNTDFKNKGISFRFSQRSINKLSCDKAINKSKLNGFSIAEHFEAINHIKELVESVDTFIKYEDRKNKDNVLAIYRGNVPVKLSTRNSYAYITIKKLKITGRLVYSLELMLKKYPSLKSEGLGQRLNKAIQLQPDCNPLPIDILSKNKNMSSKINKSLTYSGHKLQGRTKLYGMDISIENKKDITEQITSKLKTLKNENIKPEFAEKLQKSALNSQNEQITSKLQANKIEKSNSNHDALGRFTFGKKLAPDTGLTGNVINSDDVKHEDGFVLTKNGSKDFGEISKEFAKEIGRQFGKIRLMEGWHDSNSDKGSGEKHIERPKRMKQLNQVGFTNARDFVQDICDGYDAIYSSGMSLMLVKTKDLYTCIVELTPADEDFYDVKTAYVSSKNNIKNKINKQKIRLVWNSPTSLDLSKSLIPYNSKSISSIPTGFIKGTSDNSIIPNSQNMSSKNIFARGDFDEYKISDEELKEHEKDIEKGLHKYISKKFENGKWVYKYHQDRKQAVKNLISCSEPLLKCNINNAKVEGEKFIKDWNIDWSNNPNKSKSSVLGKHISIIVKDANGNDGISLIHFAHKGSKKNQPREPNEILMRAKLLPIAKEMLENKDKATVYEVRNDGNYVEYSLVGKFIQNGKEKKVCVIISKNKKEGNVYLSVMRKAISLDNDIAFITDVFLLKPSKNVQFSAEQRAYSERPFPNRNYSISKLYNKSSNINKSLTYSGYKLQGRTRLYGMDISIENKKGSYRSGVDSDGHKWRTYMNYDYGYIRETEGTDGDHVDCYIGSEENATKVYVIHQNNPVTHKYDEDKCMLCFESADAAKKAYMKQYDRPGFFGSMETLTIDKFKSFVFSKQGSRIHKSFDVIVTDITENNKLKKVEQLEKSLTALKNNQPFVIRHIPRDESTYYGNVTLKIRNFKEDSIEKAVRTLSMSLGVPVKSPKGEVFLYKAQEDLTDKWCAFFSGVINDIYDFVTDYFDLPKMTVMSKANLSYKGKVLYYPDTGKPIKEADWKKFVSNLEKFLNRNIKDSDKKIILESSALAKILNRMLKYNTLDAVTKKRLEGLSYKDKSFDWISDSVKNMQAIFKNKDKDEVLTRNEQARIQILQQSAAQRITDVTNKIKDDVQQVLIDGVKSRKSRSQVSQDLFDKMVGDNRDFQRIADTEIQNACNNAFIREEVYNSAEGEKVYFQRLEIVDDNTCSFCRQMNGKIALWSEVPLPNEKVKDDIAEFALWEGKEWNGKGHCVAMGVFHPYCRGNWIRYKPELKGLESK